MAASFSVAFTPTPMGANEKVRIQATRQLSAGVNFVPRSAYHDVFLGAAASASPSNILSAYNALFGSLVTGAKIFVRVSVLNASGFESTPVETSVVL